MVTDFVMHMIRLMPLRKQLFERGLPTPGRKIIPLFRTLHQLSLRWQLILLSNWLVYGTPLQVVQSMPSCVSYPTPPTNNLLCLVEYDANSFG